jgi:nucleoside-diphosphate kinase
MFCNFIDIMVKPDGVQRRVVGDIIARFEQKGFLLKGLKLTTPSRVQLEEHYKDLKTKSFFPKLLSYMTSGPVVAMVSPHFLMRHLVKDTDQAAF